MTRPAEMTAIAIEKPGKAARLVPVRLPVPEPGAGEVLIKVAAAGVNRADLVQAMGLYPPPPGAPETPGLEAAGTIVAVGAGVDPARIGTRVCTLLAGGGYAEYCVSPDGLALPVPDGLSDAEAGGLAEAAFTVWTNLFDSARLQPGESALIHGGTSGIGTFAIQLLAARGHIVFSTSGGPEKTRACAMLGARRAIDYRAEDFVAAVKAATGGRGVDVILDMVGGEYVARNLAALAPKGRLVNIAYQQGSQVTLNLMPVMVKRLTITGSTLRARPVPEKLEIARGVAAQVWPLVAAGRIKVQIDSTWKLADAGAAHARMASSAHVGKLILTP